MTPFRPFLIAAFASATMGASTAQTVDIAMNGGFETGDFTSWQLFESAPGQTSIVSPGASGAFAACIDNQQTTSGSVIKNNNLGIGVVAPNASATVTFDARGAGAAGGVAFAEFFSEGATGVSASLLLGGAPLGLDADPNVWTPFSFTVTTGPDVTNGVTVQFGAITGADPMSTMFLCVDNLSVTVDGVGFPEFCFGDGGDQLGCTDCPCNNNAPLGSGGGCLNSNGTSASLNGSGMASVANDSLRFEVSSATLNTFGILQSADNQLPNMGPCAAGSGILSPGILDGLRCVGGAALRHGTRATDMNGDIGVTNNGWGPPNGPAGGLIAANGFVAGQTRNFQVFYREEATLGCMSGQNSTQGVEVTFVP